MVGGCGTLEFRQFQVARLTATSASSSSGFDFTLESGAGGLTEPGGRASPQVRRAVVRLPDGVSVNPSVGAGLRVCTPAQYAAESAGSAQGAGCPNAAKIGDFSVVSPLFPEEQLTGAVYLAQPDDPATAQPGAENPFDSLLAVYLVARSAQRGILVEVAGRVDADPATGDLTATFDELPKLPYTKLALELRPGQRAPLVTPSGCGPATTQVELTPWASGLPIARAETATPIVTGIEGGACPDGSTLPFAPGAVAGGVNSNVGSYTPYFVHLIRRDTEQEITGYSMELPRGITARLAGVAFCSDAAIEAARSRRGFHELAHPSCPANSRIGRTLTGYGVGSALTYSEGLAIACAWLLAPAGGAAAADPNGPVLEIPPRGSPAYGTNYLEGPCGLAVDSAGEIFVAEYYADAVRIFSGAGSARAHLSGIDPEDGPCGLAVSPLSGESGRLYVNDLHRSVLGYEASVPPPFTLVETPYGEGGGAVGSLLDSSTPTGVAVDPASGRVYVDDRTYVAVYEPSGEPALDGEGEPLRIGAGSIEDGYGLAVSAYAGSPPPSGATAGYVYVADAGGGAVKVFDPATDADNPVATIASTPAGPFSSLRGASLAVSRAGGFVYVSDDLQPAFYARPEAAIYAFGPDGAYAGRLKYNVFDSLPTGLAVDNSGQPTAGRVYVTSGAGERAVVYGYPPGALVSGPGQPAKEPPPEASPSAGAPAGAGRDAAAGRSASGATSPGDAQASEVAQGGRLRVKVGGRLAPRGLPRTGAAPISVFVDGRISTVDGSPLPQLEQLRIEFNRHGRLDLHGLPACPLRAIQPASTARALAACRASLVGRGRFSADIVLAGQEPYPTEGRLLVFAGRRRGRPVLFGQIYAPHPFATSFVIPFTISHNGHGAYGTVLSASLPQALGDWGYVTSISMKLGRRFAYHGARHSLLSAACPAPKGFPGAVFPLARTRFGFAGGVRLTSTLTRSCSVRR